MADPFRPDLPSDAMAESFRRQVCDMMLEAGKAAIFRDMPPHDQLGAFMAGTLTGLIGVMFVFVDRQGRDGVIEAIREYLPQARDQAESIEANPTEGGSHG